VVKRDTHALDLPMAIVAPSTDTADRLQRIVELDVKVLSEHAVLQYHHLRLPRLRQM
jgi:hypothetical protein